MSILASTKRLMSDHWPEPERPEVELEPLFDDEHFELVDGHLVEKTKGAEEQSIDSDLFSWLSPFVREQSLGRAVMECKFALPNVGSNRIPDLAFVSYAKWPKSKGRPKGASWAIAPDLAVEVVSPYDLARELMSKVSEYFRAGCRSVWLIWPNVELIYVFTSPKSIKIYGVGDVLEGDPVIPGFRMPVIDLFPPEKPEANEVTP